jgi:hypothetical protein
LSDLEAQEKLKVELAAQQQEIQALNEQLTELRYDDEME